MGSVIRVGESILPLSTVKFITLPSTSIVNLCSPRLLPEVSLNWIGKDYWWHRKYEPVRDLMEQTFVSYLNQTTGHFDLLEASIKHQGVRNPVVLSGGRLTIRQWQELHPSVQPRIRRLFICETSGGSRLYVAQKLGLSVPAIVNDFEMLLPDSKAISSLLSHFKDRPGTCRVHPDGSVYVADVPMIHLARRTAPAYMLAVRKEAIKRVKDAVTDWIDRYDQ